VAAGPRSTVVVTRSVGDNASLAAELERRGFEVVAVPLVEVVAPADGGAALERAVASLDGEPPRWVVLTSVNGVRALARAMSAVRGDRPWPAGVDVAAVGPSTAAEARAAGMPVALVPSEATGTSLVESFPPAPPTGRGRRRVLAPLAELAGSTIEDGLGSKGWTVDRVEAYRTADPGGDGPDGDNTAGCVAGAAAITFFSPSVVDRWIERFGGTVPPVVVCIGPSTAGRARQRGLGGVIVAEPHTEAGVVGALERALGGSDRRSGGRPGA
jgi:uroporphyrinogen-III synthase